MDGELLRLSIASGSIDVTDFNGTQRVSLTGVLTLRDRGAVNGVDVLETSDLNASVDSLNFLGFVATGTNTARLTDIEKGFGTLEGTTLKIADKLGRRKAAQGAVRRESPAKSRGAVLESGRNGLAAGHCRHREQASTARLAPS